MKKLVGVSLFIFWAATTDIIIAGLFFYQDSKINPPVSFPPSVLADSGTIVLSSQEIARHSAVSDCWLLIDNKVYDLTSYLTVHPGGIQTISPYCGKEASQAFATKNTGSTHSANASNILASYYIGNLNQTTSAAQIQQGIQMTNQATASPGRGGDGEYDD